jgi:hypothetical protein
MLPLSPQEQHRLVKKPIEYKNAQRLNSVFSLRIRLDQEQSDVSGHKITVFYFTRVESRVIWID